MRTTVYVVVVVVPLIVVVGYIHSHTHYDSIYPRSKVGDRQMCYHMHVPDDDVYELFILLEYANKNTPVSY